MNFLTQLRVRLTKVEPEHLRVGRLGERAARRHLERQGLKFLASNFRTERGEIDLIFRDRNDPSSARAGGRLGAVLRGWRRRLSVWGLVSASRKASGVKGIPNATTCLVFVEVKTRSSEEWGRPARAVDRERRQRLSRAALDYLRSIRNPPVKLRFDIVEVLVDDGKVREVRHLPNTFALERPYRYG